MSTFSKARVGKKPYLAGSVLLNITVPGDDATIVGMLPPGATILSAVSDTASITATVSDGTTTATVACGVTPHVPDDSDNTDEIEGPGVITITVAGAASALVRITYFLNDSTLGANG